MKEVEIEFKSLLTKEMFDSICKDHEFAESFTQTNHYFDTESEILKNNNMALRIREKSNCTKLTIKHKIESDPDYYVEITDFIGVCEKNDILHNRKVVSKVILDYLEENNVELVKLTKYNMFITNRNICHFEDHILFLDETTYHNGTKDYELEVEALTHDLCEKYFNEYSNKYNLTKNTLHKIERAIINK